MIRLALLFVVLMLVMAPAWAVQMVVNGDFETGNFNGWTLDNRYPGSPATIYPSTQTLNNYPMATTYNGVYSAGWYRCDGDFLSSVPGGEGAGGGILSQSWTVTPGIYGVKVSAAVFIHNDRIGQIEDYWGAGIQIKIYIDDQTSPIWQHDFWAGEGDSFWRYYSTCKNQIYHNAPNQFYTSTGKVKMEVVWRTKWDVDIDLCAVDDIGCELIPGGPAPAGSDDFTYKNPPTWSAPLAEWNPVKKTYHWPVQSPVGGSQFHHSREYRVGLHPSCAVVGDFNSDSLLDIAVANEWSHTMSVLIATGNNSFLPAVDYPAGLNPSCVQTADVMGTPDLDLVVSCKGSAELKIFPGYGDGSFAAPISVPTGKTAAWVCLDDFNNDAKIDAAVAQLASDTLAIFLGDGAGGFTNVSTYSTGDMPGFIKSSDLNKDGNVDLVVQTFFTGESEIWQGHGNGSFTLYNAFGAGWQSTSCTIEDFNQDGNLDIFPITSFNSNGTYYLNEPSQGEFFYYSYQWYNPGEGYETLHPSFKLQPTSVASFEFNNDNRPDLAACTHNSCSAVVYQSAGLNLEDYALMGHFGVGDSGRHILAIDMDRDTLTDLVVCSSQSRTLSIVYGSPNNTFDAPHLQQLDGWYPQSGGLALADFDNDGDKDVVFGGISQLAYQLFIQENDGTSNFKERHIIPAEGQLPMPIVACAAADLNGDGNQDIVAVDRYSFSVLLGDGAFNFTTPVSYSMGAMTRDAEITDINDDGKLDVISVDNNPYSERVQVRLGDGAGGFGAVINTNIGKTAPRFFAVGDFNGDNKKDVVVAIYAAGQFVLMTGKGDGTFNAPTTYTTGAWSWGIAAADFNNDSKLDVAVANNAANNVSVFLGNGAGGFGARTNYNVGSGPLDILCDDFNLDGNVDIITTNQGDFTMSLLYGNGDGTFQPAQHYRTSGRPERIASADLRRTGVSDVVVTCSRNYSPEVFKNALLPTGAPVVTDEGTMQSSTDHISGSWSQPLFQGRPVVQYRWAVSTSPSPDDIVPGGEWQSVGTSTNATRSITLTQGETYYILAQSVDSANLRSPVGASDGITIGSTEVPTTAAAKVLADGSPVSLTGKTVSRVWSGDSWYFYIQEPDRSSGIRVRPSSAMAGQPLPAIGDTVGVSGVMATEGHERVVEFTSPLTSTSGSAPAPMAVTGRVLGGSGFYSNTVPPQGQEGVLDGNGLSNVGLLVKACGKVTRSEATENFFYIDDGSGLSDGSGYTGVRCIASGLNKPAVDAYVVVTGISGVTDIGGSPVRCIRVSKQTDIQ